jgi:hypothetical protein
VLLGCRHEEEDTMKEWTRELIDQLTEMAGAPPEWTLYRRSPPFATAEFAAASHDMASLVLTSSAGQEIPRADFLRIEYCIHGYSIKFFTSASDAPENARVVTQ